MKAEKLGNNRKKLKKLSALLLAFVLLASLAACGGGEEATPAAASGESGDPPAPAGETAAPEPADAPAGEEASADADEADPGSTRTLVVYFSRTGEQYTVGVIDHGNTAIVAEMIAEETGADLFEVVPEEDHYPMTYAELTDVAKREQTEKARPAYAGEVPDLSRYDTVYVGAPVWWGGLADDHVHLLRRERGGAVGQNAGAVFDP